MSTQQLDLTQKLQLLIRSINDLTKKQDTNLTDAIESLIQTQIQGDIPDVQLVLKDLANIIPSKDSQEFNISNYPGYDGFDSFVVEAIPDKYVEPVLETLTVTPKATSQVKEPANGVHGFSKVTVEATPLTTLTVTPTNNTQEFVSQNYNNAVGFSKVTVNAAPSNEINLQSNKQIDPPKSGSKTVLPDTDYDGFSKVTVNAIPDSYLQEKTLKITDNGDTVVTCDSDYVGLSKVTVTTEISTSTLNLQDSKTVKPSSNEQTIKPDEGYDGLKQVVVNAVNLAVCNVTPNETGGNILPTGNFTGFSEVIVAPIPETYVKPDGTFNITENNTYDIREYASVAVNVPPTEVRSPFPVEISDEEEMSNILASATTAGGIYKFTGQNSDLYKTNGLYMVSESDNPQPDEPEELIPPKLKIEGDTLYITCEDERITSVDVYIYLEDTSSDPITIHHIEI